MPRTIEQRLKKFTKIEGDCFLFTGVISSYGYGIISYNKKRIPAHRLSAHFYLGLPLDSPLYALHKPKCKHKNCWNPEHIYIGTHKDNMQDLKESITHCQKGHEYTDSNTLREWNKRTKGYKRHCRICRREMQRKK